MKYKGTSFAPSNTRGALMNFFKVFTGLGLAILAKNFATTTFNRRYFDSKVVLITGGSKGLGFVMARELLKEGARVAICARERDELERAKRKLLQYGEEVLTLVCDVTDEAQVHDMVMDTVEYFGRLDILLNNAGIIQVGPMQAFSKKEYEKAMNVMYWGIANTTLEVIPHFKEQGGGQIVNITSVGGKVSMPHLLPYDASKFAAIGFSEGSAAELRKDGIYVTAIIPGLMRTGSFVNADFQKGNEKEFNLFRILANLPMATMSAEKAAHKILNAIKTKDAVKVIGPQARMLIELHHFFPNLMVKLFSLINKQIPTSGEKNIVKGENFEDASSRGARLESMGQKEKEQFQRF